MKSPLGRSNFDIGPHYQNLLGDVIRKEKPEIVVETGLYFGYGAEFILVALDDNGKGKLYSIDPMDSGHVSNGVRTDFTGYEQNPIVHPRFTLIRKKSQDALEPLFKQVGFFDLFVHDSDHSFECQSFEYEAAWRMVRPGGIIASDDCFWGSPPHWAWDSFLKQHGITERHIIGNAQWIRKP